MPGKLLIPTLLLLCLAAGACAQAQSGELAATTADGRRVVLYTDGTWDFADNRLYDVSREGVAGYAEVDFRKMHRATVIKHTDGDTFTVLIQNPPNRLNDQERVRLLGVDTPELNRSGRPEVFAHEASEYTKGRVFNKTVYLAFDFELRDRYERVLAYVYLQDGGCLNAELLQLSHARLYTGKKYTFSGEFKLLEDEAREKKLGLWADREKSVFIADIYNDGYKEHLAIENATDTLVDLSYWRIVDKSGTVLVIPGGAALQAGQTLIIYSGQGGEHDPPYKYYLTEETIWNNKGDTAYLYSNANVLMDIYRY